MHAWGLRRGAELTDGLYSLLFLAQALEKLAFTSEIKMWVLTRESLDVTGAEDLSPSRAAALAMVRAIPQEQLNVVCRHIDIDEPEPGSPAERRLASRMLEEFASPPAALSVAWRGNQRWTHMVEPLPLSCGRDPFRTGGVYLIAGGLGRVGLILAGHLARTHKARLALTGRSAPPPRDEWQAWLEIHGEASRTGAQIRAIIALEQLGGEVLYCAANVADEQQMRVAVEATLSRFGKIDGVVHAAGISDESSFRTLLDLTPEICERHFEPKARGIEVLDRVLGDRPLDFRIAFSSLASALGGLGLAGYAAANICMDTFVRRRNRTSPASWLTVNWDTWRTSGDQHRLLGATVARFEMSPEEGLVAFETVLSNRTAASQIIQSTGDFEARLDQWVRTKPEGSACGSQAALHPRPNLASSYAGPENDTQRAIVEFWQTLIGIEPIGIHDNFFELGGHSLSGTQLVSRLRQAFGVTLPLTILFQAPTVAELAVAIEMAVIEEIEMLTDEQVRDG